jgi:acyl-CoA reductase-like NAD-dependent aldehyde dehydrogenase
VSIDMAFRSINPATGAVNGEYAEMSSEEVAAILAHADHAFQDWRRRSIAQRSVPMRAAGIREFVNVKTIVVAAGHAHTRADSHQR